MEIEKICQADRRYTQRIRDFNLISQKHQNRNRNLIHCSEMGKRQEGQRRWGSRGEEERETRRGKIHFHTWLIEEILQYHSSWKQKQRQMSHVSVSSLIRCLSIHLPHFLSSLTRSLTHSPNELATFFLSLLLLCFLPSHSHLFFLSLLPLWTQPPLISLLLNVCLTMCWNQTTAPSGLISHVQVWCQPLGQCYMQTALSTVLDLIGMHAVQWKEEQEEKTCSSAAG